NRTEKGRREDGERAPPSRRILDSQVKGPNPHAACAPPRQSAGRARHGYAHSGLAVQGRRHLQLEAIGPAQARGVELVPPFRSSSSIAALLFTNFGKSWALPNL